MKLLFLTPSNLIPKEDKYLGLKVLTLDEEFQKIIDTIPQIIYITQALKPLEEFLLSAVNEEDITPIIEGDFGFIYYMTSFCHDNHIMPLYRSNKILKSYTKY